MAVPITPQSPGQLLATLDEAEADLESGRYSDYTDETLPNLAAQVKGRGTGHT